VHPTRPSRRSSTFSRHNSGQVPHHGVGSPGQAAPRSCVNRATRRLRQSDAHSGDGFAHDPADRRPLRPCGPHVAPPARSEMHQDISRRRVQRHPGDARRLPHLARHGGAAASGVRGHHRDRVSGSRRARPCCGGPCARPPSAASAPLTRGFDRYGRRTVTYRQRRSSGERADHGFQVSWFMARSRRSPACRRLRTVPRSNVARNAVVMDGPVEDVFTVLLDASACPAWVVGTRAVQRERYHGKTRR
jgi:hypothetical protein